MKLRLLHTPSTRGSQSLKRLADALSAKLGYKVWRSTKEKAGGEHLSYGQGVDKLTQYRWFAEQGLSALEFTTDAKQADDWFAAGEVVIGRGLLNSSCGKGIVIFGPVDDDVEYSPFDIDCPVYTKYKKKKREFRVHLFRDEVVAVVEKKLRSNWNGQRESKIRNLANGYVFCSCQDEPAGLRELAVKASGVVTSDFKGVDMGYNEHKQELFVIEVNAAPGIEGSNVDKYVKTIVEKLGV